MDRTAAITRQLTVPAAVSTAQELGTEIVRKSIHMLIALVPGLALVFGVQFTLALLGAGTLFYSYCEMLRIQGHSVALVSRLTSIASRRRELGRFTLGPITLGLGAMIALLFYPDPAASIAIYALAFGDGLASLFGKVFGRTIVPGTGGKTVEGSMACFVAVYFSVYALTGGSFEAGIIAAAAALLELIPSSDLDNLVLPAGTGLIAAMLFM